LKQQLICFLFFTLFAGQAFSQTEFPLTETELPLTQPEAQPVKAETKNDVVILKDPEILATYLLAPGDALEITVWKEEGLQQQQFLIGPDGNIIYPLIGTITAAGRTIHDLNELLTVKLADYIADPSVSIKLLNNQGNAIFVIGKVNKPGQVFCR
jgi:polysaccharide biosynthesis/export protein